MSTHHFSLGSEFPALDPGGTVRLYSMKFCPYAQRPRLVAHAKGTPLDVVNCNLKQKPEWLFQRNPTGKVPTLELPGNKQTIFESLIICDYLDEVGRGRALQPLDAFQRALDRVWLERFNQVIKLYYDCAYRSSAEDVPQTIKDFNTEIEFFEVELKRRETSYFGGSEPSMLDFMIWPWVERLPVFGLLYPTLFNYRDFQKSLPTLTQWTAAMKSNPSVLATSIDPDTHFEYIKSSRGGAPNYNL